MLTIQLEYGTLVRAISKRYQFAVRVCEAVEAECHNAIAAARTKWLRQTFLAADLPGS